MIHTASILLLACAVTGLGPETPSGGIQVHSTLIKPLDEAAIPARESGVLVAMNVREGAMVEENQRLAQIDDSAAQTDKDRAQLEVAISREVAENDVRIRSAEKSVEVAKAELRRASDSVKQFARSVSQSELDRLRLTVEHATLAVEEARREVRIARLTRKVKENELATAVRQVMRRRITAPFAGVIAQIGAKPGEWVEPGETVLRILRLNRLRAEGFINARELTEDLRGREVKLTVDLPGRGEFDFSGKLVFVSPEIDPVNAQVRVWAEVDNKDLLLLPGMRAEMTILRPAAGLTRK